MAPSGIKVDIDRKRVPRWTWETARMLDLALARAERSKNKGWHLWFKSPRKLSDVETILIQLLLGSDRKRELYNYMRVKNGARLDDWNLLFDEKYI